MLRQVLPALGNQVLYPKLTWKGTQNNIYTLHVDLDVWYQIEESLFRRYTKKENISTFLDILSKVDRCRADVSCHIIKLNELHSCCYQPHDIKYDNVCTTLDMYDTNTHSEGQPHPGVVFAAQHQHLAAKKKVQ